MSRVAAAGAVFAKVEDERIALARHDQQISAAADIAGRRIRDRQGERRRHRAIDGVAAFLLDDDADIGRRATYADDRAVLTVNGMIVGHCRREGTSRSQETNPAKRIVSSFVLFRQNRIDWSTVVCIDTDGNIPRA